MWKSLKEIRDFAQNDLLKNWLLWGIVLCVFSPQIFAQQHRVWHIEFEGHGTAPIAATVFDYEFFVNGQMKKQVQSALPQRVNEIIAELAERIEVSDLLQVVLLNHDYLFINVRSLDRQKIFHGGELILNFTGQDSLLFSLEILPRAPIHFFYIESSGGIENLLFLKTQLDRLVQTGQPFMVYYNGPGRKVFFREPEELTPFFNMLFTSITQPPFPSEELKNVKTLLKANLPMDMRNVVLHMHFYLSEISFNRLSEHFVKPLVAVLFQDNLVHHNTINIYTDFEVRNKEQAFSYINIASQH